MITWLRRCRRPVIVLVSYTRLLLLLLFYYSFFFPLATASPWLSRSPISLSLCMRAAACFAKNSSLATTTTMQIKRAECTLIVYTASALGRQPIVLGDTHTHTHTYLRGESQTDYWGVVHLSLYLSAFSKIHDACSVRFSFFFSLLFFYFVGVLWENFIERKTLLSSVILGWSLLLRRKANRQSRTWFFSRARKFMPITYRIFF